MDSLPSLVAPVHRRESACLNDLGNRWVTIAALVVALSTIVAYSGSLSGPFLLDDTPRIVEDVRLRSAWPPGPVLASSNRPLAHYTFALNYALHGYDVHGYHVTNLLIHLLAALALMGTARRGWWLIYPQRPEAAIALAWAVAMLWAVHPLNTQAVSYIVQRLESMMALFYLLTLYAFLRAQQSVRFQNVWYGVSIACCAIGMGCKEVMVTAPLVVLWFDRAVVAGSWRELITRRWFYYGALVASWSMLAWAMLHYQDDYRGGGLLSVEGLTPWIYLTNQAQVLTHYLQLLFWPAGQCAYYGWKVEYSLMRLWPYLLVMAGLWLAAVVLCFRKPALGWLAMSFFIVLAPTSSVVPIIDLAFEHRMYLPSAAVIALVVSLVARGLGLLKPANTSVPKQLIQPRWLAAGALLVSASVALGATTYARNAVYSSEEMFWRDITEKAPHSFNGWLGLGNVYAKRGQVQQADECSQRALEVAADEPRPQATMAGILIARGEYEPAAELLRQASQRAPSLPEVVINYGLLLSLTGKFAEAQPYLEAGVQVAPEDEELQTNLVVNLCYLQRMNEALERALANQAARPHSARAVTDVAACYLASGDAAAAVRYAQQALRLDDQLARAHATLGMARADREPLEAIASLQRACQLDTQAYEFHVALGNLQLAQDPKAAVTAYRQAVALRPQEIETLLRLAMAYDASGQPEQAVPLLENALKQQPDLAPVRAYLRSIRQKVRRH